MVLDYLIITHYHGDLAGNAAELASRIPMRHFIDHGPYTVELQPERVAAFASYQALRDKAHAITAKPGDRIPVASLDVRVVSSAGELITRPIEGAPAAVLLAAGMQMDPAAPIAKTAAVDGRATEPIA